MLSGCGGSAAKTDDSSADAADTSASAESDVDYVKEQRQAGYQHHGFRADGLQDGLGTARVSQVILIADMAKAFAESLGVKPEFIRDWDNKIMELDSRALTVWNGMTLTDEVRPP